MKTIDINVDSWFNRFLGHLTTIYWDEIDFCSYCRKALYNIFLLALALFLFVTLSTSTGVIVLASMKVPEIIREWGIVYWPAAFVIGFLTIDIVALIFVAVLFVGVALFNRLDKSYRAWRFENYDPDKKPSVIVTGYHSLKDKTCFKINPVHK